MRSSPILGKGPLCELCLTLKETLMSDKLEGVVLTGKDTSLFKWKTSTEDESKGYNLLSSLLVSFSNEILELACVDVAFAQCLADVAKKEVVAKNTKIRMKKQKSKTIEPFEKETIDRAFASALSKYDALEAYFEREERSTILANLNKELVEDLGASTDEEIKFIGRELGKRVGVAYGKWIRTKT